MKDAVQFLYRAADELVRYKDQMNRNALTLSFIPYAVTSRRTWRKISLWSDWQNSIILIHPICRDSLSRKWE